MPFLSLLLASITQVFLEAAPYLIFGLLAAGLVNALLPESFLLRFLGKGRFMPILKAAEKAARTFATREALALYDEYSGRLAAAREVSRIW